VSPIRSLARPLLASMFVAGGIDALRNPAPRVAKTEAAGLAEPDQLVRVNAATMVGAGLMLGTGRLPRLSSLVLAGTLVPTTFVGHPFWQESDAGAKAQQRVHFLKNVSLLGGLLLSFADTGGRESVPHAAARLSRRARRKAAKAAEKAEKRATKTASKAEKRATKAAKKAQDYLPAA
jgi:putative oxidoreductase